MHPVYKAFALLFHPEMQTRDLQSFRKHPNEGIVLDAEAGSILSWIYSGYEYDYENP